MDMVAEMGSTEEALNLAQANSPIALAEALAGRYKLTALEPLLGACKTASASEELNIAVLGRFKAGKSSFLNQLIGRDLLPVGVVPVTAIITEIICAEREVAEVSFLNGETRPFALAEVEEFITEKANPGNKKGVSKVVLHICGVQGFKGFRFVDTPGLESTFAHNTEASLNWIPNTDLTLVAVGVDPPLSQQDLVLIRKLLRYSPRVCVLLTKVDILNEAERSEVLEFVTGQLNANLEQSVEVFAYSTRQGFEGLRKRLREEFLDPVLNEVGRQKQEIVQHKTRSLLRECQDYLQLRLRSAEVMDSERQQLRMTAVATKETIADTGLELQLIAKHNIAAARAHIEKTLRPFEKSIKRELGTEFEDAYPSWRMSFAKLLREFDTWIRARLANELSVLSATSEAEFLKPLREAERQYLHVLQAFRNRLSERTMELFGVPLRTTETPMDPVPPKAPDIRVGRLFDHNWELLSPVLPMPLLRGLVRQRFRDRVKEETFNNVSRLTAQWEDIVAASVTEMRQQAERRLREFINTVDSLTSASASDLHLRSDLAALNQAEQRLHSSDVRIDSGNGE